MALSCYLFGILFVLLDILLSTIVIYLIENYYQEKDE